MGAMKGAEYVQATRNRGSCAFPDGLITALPSAERQAVSRPDDPMKKELIIFGAVVVLCLGVTAFALMKPKAKPKTDTGYSSSYTSSDSLGSSSTSDFSSSTSSTSPGSLGASDSLSSTSSLYPPTTELNPNKPFDTTSTGVGTTSTSNPFPGSSTSSFPSGSTTSSFPGSSTTSTGSGLGSAGSTTSGTGLGSSSGFGPSTSLLDPVPAVSEAKTHTVKKGEILGDISRTYYGSSKHWRKIAEANNIKAEGLQEGMKLTIPALDVAPVSATDTGTADAGTYVVKKGDSYYKIAKKELGDASRYKELERLNGVAAEDLREGQKIKLPAKSSTSSDAGVVPGPEAAIGGRTHTVASGEYLSDISKKYYGSTKHWKEIVAANPGVTPERLKVGQKLVIPELAGKATTSAVGGADVVASADEWIVKKGDTFEVIAAKTLGDKNKWKKIQEVNPGVDSSNLKIGQKIKLPAGAIGNEPAAIPSPLAPSSSFPTTPSSTVPGPASTFPSSSTTPAPKPGLPGPATTDPWAPLPSATDTGTSTAPSTGTTTGTTGTSVPYSDPWKDFSTPAPSTTTGTGAGTTP